MSLTKELMAQITRTPTLQRKLALTLCASERCSNLHHSPLNSTTSSSFLLADRPAHYLLCGAWHHLAPVRRLRLTIRLALRGAFETFTDESQDFWISAREDSQTPWTQEPQPVAQHSLRKVEQHSPEVPLLRQQRLGNRDAQAVGEVKCFPVQSAVDCRPQ